MSRQITYKWNRSLTSAKYNTQFDTPLGWVQTCNVTAYRNTVSWECGRDSWTRNVSKVGYAETLRVVQYPVGIWPSHQRDDTVTAGAGVLWVAYATHSTLKPVLALPR